MRHVMVFFVSLVCLGALLAVAPLDAAAQDDSTGELVFLKPPPSEEPHIVDMKAEGDKTGAACTIQNVFISGSAATLEASPGIVATPEASPGIAATPESSLDTAATPESSLDTAATPESSLDTAATSIDHSEQGTRYIQVQNDSESEGVLIFSFLSASISMICSPSDSANVGPGDVLGATIAFELKETDTNVNGTLFASMDIQAGDPPANSRLVAGLPITLQVSPTPTDWTKTEVEPTKVQMMVTHRIPALINDNRSAVFAIVLGLLLVASSFIWRGVRQRHFLRRLECKEQLSDCDCKPLAAEAASTESLARLKRKVAPNGLGELLNHWGVPMIVGLTLVWAGAAYISDRQDFEPIEVLDGEVQDVRIYGATQPQLDIAIYDTGCRTLLSEKNGETALIDLRPRTAEDLDCETPVPTPTGASKPGDPAPTPDFASASVEFVNSTGVGEFDGTVKLDAPTENALAFEVNAIVRDWWIWPLLAILFGSWIGWILNYAYDQWRAKRLISTTLCRVREDFNESRKKIAPGTEFSRLFDCQLDVRIVDTCVDCLSQDRPIDEADLTTNCKSEISQTPEFQECIRTDSQEQCSRRYLTRVQRCIDVSFGNHHAELRRDCVAETNSTSIHCQIKTLENAWKTAANKEALDKVASDVVDLQNMVKAWPELCRVVDDLKWIRDQIGLQLNELTSDDLSNIQPLLVRASDVLRTRVRPAYAPVDAPEQLNWTWALSTSKDVTRRTDEIIELSGLLIQLEHILTVNKIAEKYYELYGGRDSALNPQSLLISRVAEIRDAESLGKLLESVTENFDKILDGAPTPNQVLSVLARYLHGAIWESDEELLSFYIARLRLDETQKNALTGYHARTDKVRLLNMINVAGVLTTEQVAAVQRYLEGMPQDEDEAHIDAILALTYFSENQKEALRWYRDNRETLIAEREYLDSLLEQRDFAGVTEFSEVLRLHPKLPTGELASSTFATLFSIRPNLATAAEMTKHIRTTDAIVSMAAILLAAVALLLTKYPESAFGRWPQYLGLITATAASTTIINQAFLPWMRSYKLPAGDSSKATPESN